MKTISSIYFLTAAFALCSCSPSLSNFNAKALQLDSNTKRVTISQESVALSTTNSFYQVPSKGQTLANIGWIGVPTLVTMSSGKVLVFGGMDTLGNYLATTEIFDPSTGIWSITGSLHTGRNAANGVLLENGQILAIAGYGTGGGQLSSCELYDPSTGVWTPTGSTQQSRVAFTSTLLPNGYVLATGGFGTSNAELYNPSTGLWSYPSHAAPVSGNAGTATLLPSLGSEGQVLVAGGASGSSYMTTAYLYDVANETWTATGALNLGRRYSSTALLSDDKILIVGGYTAAGVSGTCELYNVASGTWSMTGALPVADAPLGQLLPNGKYLAIQFPTAQIYDPATGSWTAAVSTNNHSTRGSGALLQDGRFLLFSNANTGIDYGEIFSTYSPIPFTAAGGTPPYSYEILSGTGSINASTGLYIPPSSGGFSEVRVVDANGSYDTSAVSLGN